MRSWVRLLVESATPRLCFDHADRRVRRESATFAHRSAIDFAGRVHRDVGHDFFLSIPRRPPFQPIAYSDCHAPAKPTACSVLVGDLLPEPADVLRHVLDLALVRRQLRLEADPPQRLVAFQGRQAVGRGCRRGSSCTREYRSAAIAAGRTCSRSSPCALALVHVALLGDLLHGDSASSSRS